MAEDTLLRDTAEMLYDKLVMQAEKMKSVFVEFKDFKVVYHMFSNFITLQYIKDNQILHDITLNDFSNMNHLFIRDEIIKNTLMLYIKNALETLSDKELEEVFDSLYGKMGV